MCLVSSTEEASASVIVEQSEVASGRSISSGSFANINQNDKPLKTTGFGGFKEKNSFNGQVNGKTSSSPIPFVIPSYASGIIFRDSDNDRSPQVEIQPAINVLSKTIGPEEASKFPGPDYTTVSTYNQITPGANFNSFQQKPFASLQTTPSTAPAEEQNIAPFQPVATTSAPSQFNTKQTANEPRFSDINKRIDILGLQSPGYAIRSDGSIDSDAIPPNFIGVTNFASNPLNSLNFEAPTTTQRISRTTQNHFGNPRFTQAPLSNAVPRFIPSADNPFLPRQSNLFASTDKSTIAGTTQPPYTMFQPSTQTAFKGFTSFANGTPVKSGLQAGQNVPAFNGFNNFNNRNSVGAFAPLNNNIANPSAFSTSAPKFMFNHGNNNLSNQLLSRQSNNELSNNVQQQAQQKTPFVINLDSGARLPTFGGTEIPTKSPQTDVTTKFASSFITTPPTTVPTYRAPAGFSFSAFSPTTATQTTTTTPRSTFSTLFPSRLFSTTPPTIAPSVQGNALTLNSNQPSLELLPPVDSNAPPKSAFAAINEPGSQTKLNAPAVNNRNQQTFGAAKSPNMVNTTPKSSTFSAVPVTRGPVKFTTSVNQFPSKFSTIFPTPTTKAATTIPPSVQFNKPTSNALQPSLDLLPPSDANTQTRADIAPSNDVMENKASSTSPSVDLPYNELLPPSNTQKPNSQLANTNTVTTTTFKPFSIKAFTTTNLPPITTTNVPATTITERSPIKPELELNPFLPPIGSASISTGTEQNNYTTITLEQNPFLPRLDLNPFLPPFEFSIKATDAPPIASASTTIDMKTATAPSQFSFAPASQATVFGNVAKSQNSPNVATSAQKSQHQPQPTTAFNTKYTGGFGGPPGILAPFDNNNNRGK